MHIGMAETEMRGTIDLQQMIFKGVPLEKAEQKELIDLEDESMGVDTWSRGRFVKRNIEKLLGIGKDEMLKMYLMGEIRGGISVTGRRGEEI